MTQRSIEEYAAALRRRYHSSGRLDKGKILDEFCETTGHHRKSAIRLGGRGQEAFTAKRATQAICFSRGAGSESGMGSRG